jgi:hypothetical protein
MTTFELVKITAMSNYIVEKPGKLTFHRISVDSSNTSPATPSIDSKIFSNPNNMKLPPSSFAYDL